MKAGKMSASQPIALQLDRVSRRFGRQEVLVDVSLSVPRGGITCLLGESGCGKSTLLGLISGIDRPDGGRIDLRSDGLEKMKGAS